MIVRDELLGNRLLVNTEIRCLAVEVLVTGPILCIGTIIPQ